MTQLVHIKHNVQGKSSNKKKGDVSLLRINAVLQNPYPLHVSAQLHNFKMEERERDTS